MKCRNREEEYNHLGTTPVRDPTREVPGTQGGDAHGNRRSTHRGPKQKNNCILPTKFSVSYLKPYRRLLFVNYLSPNICAAQYITPSVRTSDDDDKEYYKTSIELHRHMFTPSLYEAYILCL